MWSQWEKGFNTINHDLNQIKGGEKMSQTKGILRQVDEAESETLKRISTVWRNSAFDDMNLLRTLALRQGVLEIFLGFMRYILVLKLSAVYCGELQY
jgi:hypothetical protein